MKRQVTSILLFSALLVGGASTFVSCKDTESDALYDSNGKVAEVIANQAKQISDLADKLTKETEKRESEDQVLKELITSKATDIKATADEALRLAKANEITIGTLQGKITTLEGQLSSLLDLSRKVTGLETEVNTLKTQFANFKSCTCDFTTLNNNYEKLKLEQEEDRRRIIAIEQGKSNLDTELDRINTTLNGKVDQTTFDDLKRQVEANERKISTNKADIDELRNNFANYVEKSYLTSNYYTKADVDNAITNASTVLEGKISALETKLTTQLNELFNAMANEVTGVNIDNFYSQILGSFEEPIFNSKTCLLGGYYGYASEPISIGNEDIFADELLLDETTGKNAGTIGVLINPQNKNFSGLRFKIVDRDGNVTPFIATAQKTSGEGTFGVTRANEQVPMNYYTLSINVDPARIDEVKTWNSSDAENLKEAAKNILNKLKNRSNNLNITEISNTLYHTLNHRLTKYYLYLEQDIKAGENNTVNTQLGQIPFAATFIKPLSYKFLSGGINYDIKDIPTLESKGLYIDTSSLKWKDLNHIADINQSIDIDVPDASTMMIDGNKVTINAKGELVWADPNNRTSIDDLKGVNVTVKGITFAANAVSYDTKKQTVKVTVSMKQFNDLIDQINSQVGNMLGTVENLANKVNKFESAIDGNFINRINSYIHKCNYYLDNANKFLQPAMFATDGNNWVKLPTIASGATYVKMTNGKANVLLLPTSYTLEYLAPAYKKYITVKDPSGNTVTGENIGKVISGNIRKAGFTATKEGVYTITYDAVDYTGGDAHKTFFIKVVK